MISLFRKKRIIKTALSVEELIERLLKLDNKFVTDTKYLEVKVKGTRTFGLSFYKNIGYPQMNYSVAKELWIETTGEESLIHIKTRPIDFIWTLPVLMLPMLPSAISEHGWDALCIFIVPIVFLELWFLSKSTFENSLLDEFIEKVVK
ncbi:hypothetical protein [Pseudoalteromonas luteoviolacea]|nr:hypothetical protein [Pseudoalteromonas luteoviolacea]